MKIGILGLDSFGFESAIQLAEKGLEVIAIDKDKIKIEKIHPHVTQAISLNFYNEESLRSIGLEEIDTLLISINENFEDSLLLTRLAKHNLQIKHVIVRSSSNTKKDILKLVGADQVVMPEKEAAIEFADQLASPFTHSTTLSSNFSIIDIRTPEEFVGKNISEINFEDNYQCKLIGIKRGEKVSLGRNETIEEEDILYLAGKNKHLKDVFNL